MPAIDAIQVYLITLSVIQPARIQDIEKNSSLLFGDEIIDEIGANSLRKTHELARKSELVISVRRGLRWSRFVGQFCGLFKVYSVV